jgi:hypothetical protein
MTKKPWRMLPITPLGKASVGLIVAMLLLFVIGTSSTNWLYPSVPAGMAAGISACITGLLAIIRQKERALLVYVSTAIGALLAFFLAGEIMPPN